MLSTNTNNTASFCKESLKKQDRKKIYRSKIRIGLPKTNVYNYLLNMSNRFIFNKFIKDGIKITENIDYSTFYLLYDFKLLSKKRNFIVAESKMQIKMGEKILDIVYMKSIDHKFEFDYENSERAKIYSSGYFVTDCENPQESLLGFWIESEITNDENLQDTIMKDYLNHIKNLRDNLMFNEIN